MTNHGDPIPKGEGEPPVNEIRERLNILLTQDNKEAGAALDFLFDEATQGMFGIRTVQIDRDDSLKATFITLLRPQEQGVYASEERYLFFDDDRLIHERVHVHYTYEETTARYDYEKELEDWKNYLITLVYEGKLEELDELMAMDRLIANYSSARDKHSRVLRELSWESEDGTIDQSTLYTAQAVYNEVLNDCAEQIAEHLLETTQHLSDTERHFYTELFKRVIAKFDKRYDCEMLATKRFVEASQDANLRLEEGLSPDTAPKQAWKLLTVLDACE